MILPKRPDSYDRTSQLDWGVSVIGHSHGLAGQEGFEDEQLGA